jgi:hypothetical protein
MIQQSRQEVLGQQIVESKAANFKGTARVDISFLSFPYSIRPNYDKNRVADIIRIFEKQGCIYLDPDLHIPAIIDDKTLQDAMSNAGVSLEELKRNGGYKPPELTFPSGFMLECLHGQRRVIAAAQYLPPEKRWWVVALYGPGKSIA